MAAPSFDDQQIIVLHRLHGMSAATAAELPFLELPVWTEQRAYLRSRGSTPCVHIAVELMNEQTKAAGSPQWAKCPNCGTVYPVSQEGSDGTVCSERCANEFAQYLMGGEGS